MGFLIEGLALRVKNKNAINTPFSSANFVGCVIGFLDVLIIRLRSLLLAAALSCESDVLK